VSRRDEHGIAVITLPPSAFRSLVPEEVQLQIIRKVRRKERATGLAALENSPTACFPADKVRGRCVQAFPDSAQPQKTTFGGFD
jgi:tRNA/tmRNA/rRNA uracil-C5-methylase (TrmA/RlmC/RlmD family)